MLVVRDYGNKIMNNFKKIAIVSSLLLSIGFSVTPTFASPSSYDGCVSRTWDHIGCWLSDVLGGDYIMPGGPDGGDTGRIEKMRKDGLMQASNQKTLNKNGGKYVAICESDKILNMIEQKASAKQVAGTCYRNSPTLKEVKKGAVSGKAKAMNLKIKK